MYNWGKHIWMLVCVQIIQSKCERWLRETLACSHTHAHTQISIAAGGGDFLLGADNHLFPTHWSTFDLSLHLFLFFKHHNRLNKTRFISFDLSFELFLNSFFCVCVQAPPPLFFPNPQITACKHLCCFCFAAVWFPLYRSDHYIHICPRVWTQGPRDGDDYRFKVAIKAAWWWGYSRSTPPSPNWPTSSLQSSRQHSDNKGRVLWNTDPALALL